MLSINRCSTDVINTLTFDSANMGRIFEVAKGFEEKFSNLG